MKTIGILLFVLSFVLMGIIATAIVKHTNQKYAKLEKEVFIRDRVLIATKLDLAKKTVDWVYNRSERINYLTAKEIVEEANKMSHPVLILAVVSAESNFNPSALSNKGAIGLGQIMYTIWGKELEKQKIIKTRRDLFGIQDNLRATDYILKVILKECKGNVIEALYRYLGTPRLKYSNSIFIDYVALSTLKDEK